MKHHIKIRWLAHNNTNTNTTTSKKWRHDIWCQRGTVLVESQPKLVGLSKAALELALKLRPPHLNSLQEFAFPGAWTAMNRVAPIANHFYAQKQVIWCDLLTPIFCWREKPPRWLLWVTPPQTHMSDMSPIHLDFSVGQSALLKSIQVYWIPRLLSALEAQEAPVTHLSQWTCWSGWHK